MLNRRRAPLLALAALCVVSSTAAYAEPTWRHALSLVGEPAMPPDFKHFPWVNPAAPKGGSVRLWAPGTFDTMNPFPLGGNPAAGIGLIYDTLMVGSLDEASTEYGLIAEAVSFPDDYSSVTFRLRTEARFQDGEPIKPEDVIFSFEQQKTVNPQTEQYYKNVVTAEKTGDREVTFGFDVKGNRELPQIMGQLVVLPKHYWTATGKDGKPRDLAKTTLEPPVGSGAYRIKSFEAGRSITYELVADYWAKDLPVNVGQNNIALIQYDYYRDQTVAFEGFKSGRIDFYVESSAKNWATAYTFEGIRNGFVQQRKIELKTPEGMQGFVLNTRRSKFADPRVRQAFNLAFDFEWSNKNLFFDQYVRSDSYFENSELASSGLPQGRELEILNEIKDLVPPEVFTTEYKNPFNADLGSFRQNLRRATDLLTAAGWSIKGGKLTNDATGEVMTVEFLLDAPTFERIVLPYIKNLERLGIKGTVRQVDDTQYVQRMEGYDFDIAVATIPQSESPGNEQRYFFGSQAADTKGTRNFAGIKNPAVDKLIDKIIFAKDRADLIAATRALDRVLLWNHYVVPQWHVPYDRVAYWDKYKRLEPGPSRSVGFPNVWWFDQEGAAKVEPAQKK
jgi:microcin C transport system substrate-binding protein